MTIIDTRTIKNFLTDDEIAEIENMHSQGMTTLLIDNLKKPPIEGLDRTANYWHFDFYCKYSENGRRIQEILLPKLQELFHKDIYIDDCHILESFYPYELHTDSVDNGKDYTMQAGNDYTYAWTFIIPLDNYDSNTIIFDQESLDIKGPTRWIEDKNPPVLNAIDEETYIKYLSQAVNPLHYQYLSIEEIFLWKKGSLSATSRGKFHCSDYFLDNGITEKRAIVMWTTVPNFRNPK